MCWPECRGTNDVASLGYLLALLMGGTLGLIGAGGSILAVPILVHLLRLPAVAATGYSLAIVGSPPLARKSWIIKK